MILKVAYLGKDFCGSQVQPHGRTVEAELESVLKKLDAIDCDCSRLRLLSRTDSGVSAACNLAVFESKGDVDTGRINHELPDDIFVTGKSEGKVRYPVNKHYAYLLENFDDTVEVSKLKSAARLFCGEHDFSAFSKVDSSCEKSSVRTIKVQVEVCNNFIIIHFYGAGFLWQMIRRIVQCMVDFSEGSISKGDIAEFLRGKKSQAYTPAPSENLILADIDAGLKFDCDEKVQRRIKEKMGLLEKELFFFSQL